VFLPIVEARPDEETEAVADTPRGSEKILVVEDNEELRSLLRTVLSEQGYGSSKRWTASTPSKSNSSAGRTSSSSMLSCRR
jgi:hypothetical protein